MLAGCERGIMEQGIHTSTVIAACMGSHIRGSGLRGHDQDSWRRMVNSDCAALSARPWRIMMGICLNAVRGGARVAAVRWTWCGQNFNLAPVSSGGIGVHLRQEFARVGTGNPSESHVADVALTIS